ncbi:hypothetical protein CYFUS_006516 [Cystobacter fuscus]|uniref:Uncharacterized protein n=1 Tax=Cystobacter fuscus TaxID=43 RepID=A0A250JAV7_9BACT|nr:hypothetical protein [Cystobacter fuscus]ATB41054.1 hypothetical protein CYFUS_006516 [Cystobacter fuscus]
MEPSYVYWINPTPQGPVVTALFPDKGSVDVSGNHDGRQEIGYYEHVLPRKVFDHVLALLDQAGLENLPVSPTLPPDTPVTSVGKSWAQRQPPMVRGYALWQVPKALQPTMDEFRLQTTELLKHPVRAIQGEGVPVKSQFLLEDTPAFTITLKNVGTEPLKLDNPFHKRMEEALTLHLRVRKDKPPDQLREGDTVWIECKLDHVRLADPKAVTPAGRQLTLAAGAELRFFIRKKLMLAPGRYIAELDYRTSRFKDDVSSLSGRLNMRLGSFEVLDK